MGITGSPSKTGQASLTTKTKLACKMLTFLNELQSLGALYAGHAGFCLALCCLGCPVCEEYHAWKAHTLDHGSAD